MPNIDKHAPGSFSWIELATEDPDGARNFYTKLFGWTAGVSPPETEGRYTILQLRSRAVAAIRTLRPEPREQYTPTWLLYVCVESADAIASRADALGGRVLPKPFDVFEYGRMAVIRDLKSAMFAVWQPNRFTGMGIQGEPGAFCWADLNTPDQREAIRFYAGLFGWYISAGEPDGEYLHIMSGGQPIAGIPQAAQRDPKVSSSWLIYFQVEDVFASTNKAKELGATIHLPATTTEHVGDISVLADPQGAMFALFSPEKKAAP
jgi:predicted enzyme related to lactoylglutathione lyase